MIAILTGVFGKYIVGFIVAAGVGIVAFFTGHTRATNKVTAQKDGEIATVKTDAAVALQVTKDQADAQVAAAKSQVDAAVAKTAAVQGRAQTDEDVSKLSDKEVQDELAKDWSRPVS